MRKLLLSLLTICFLGTTASAQVAQQVAVLYHGELIISFEPINDESEVLYNQTVELKAADDNTVDFLLSDFNAFADFIIQNFNKNVKKYCI